MLGEGFREPSTQKSEGIVLKLAVEHVLEGPEWGFASGQRAVELHMRAPQAGITDNTGLMLELHNWGGRYYDAHYLHWCASFADRLSMIAISINYLYSGVTTVKANEPYDHGYLQAMDCLRALYNVQWQHDDAGVLFQ